jgi:hypothetical protein
MDFLRQDTPHDGTAVLDRNRSLVGDRGEQRALLLGEARVAVTDELADLAPLPPERKPNRVCSGAPLGPRDLPVLEHERRAGRADCVNRRTDDGLERFLQVEGLRDSLGDPRQRLELADPLLGLGVELCVLDRLGDLPGDRYEQVDLVAGELPWGQGADVQRAGELLAGEDGDSKDRLVLILGEIRKPLEAGVEVGLARDHDGCALVGGRAGDPLARAHTWPAGHSFHRRAVGGA